MLEKTIQRLREVNEEVPIPLRLPTDEEILSAEIALDTKFHPDFKKYLKEASDVVFGAVEPLVVVPGDDPLFLPLVAKEAWDYGLPKELFPICEDNGDYFAMDKNGQVHYWSHNGETNEKWPDLSTWINEVWLEE
ncbi:MAG: SMI1/KNR4 family protein [Bacteroidota bacterium]